MYSKKYTITAVHPEIVAETGTSIGQIDISTADIAPKQVLESLFRYKLRNREGLTMPAIPTTDRRRVYAKDINGDGTRWEVGNVAGWTPLFLLDLADSSPGRTEDRVPELLHNSRLTLAP